MISEIQNLMKRNTGYRGKTATRNTGSRKSRLEIFPQPDKIYSGNLDRGMDVTDKYRIDSGEN